jgi:hypothetical protein
MKPFTAAVALALGAWLAGMSAAAAQTPSSPTIAQLLTQGYVLRAASSNGATQFLYFQGVDQSGHKKIYACQLQFGSNGGFQGCLVLP